MANVKGKKAAWVQLFKRNAVVGAVVLFVCVAVYLNWDYQKTGQMTDAGKTLGGSTLVAGQADDPLVSGSQSQQDTDTAGDYFANARLNRQQARDSALTILQDSLMGETADAAMKEQTGAAIQTMADCTVTEAQIENLVLAKGYTDCVAFIGEDSISVVVRPASGALTAVDTAKITDIVTQTADISPDRIKIIEVN